MKNLLKTGALMAFISVSLLACEPPTTSKKPVIDTPQKSIDTANKAVVDSVKGTV